MIRHELATVVMCGISMLIGIGGGFSSGLAASETAEPATKGSTSTGKERRRGPLSGLPTETGAHIEKLKALGDNQWLELGPPEPDPKWGRARGRAWGGKAFALAPEIRGAFFAGEGVHAFVKPDGHGMDDMWVYDINAHRWVCIYPGTDTNTFNQRVKDGSIRVSDTGQVVDAEGAPIPGHLIIHAWGFLAYDTDRRKFAIGVNTTGFYRYFMPGGKDRIDEGLKELEKQGLKEKSNPHLGPWFYDTRTGRFEQELGTDPFPNRGRVGGYPQFIYVSSRKKFFLGGSAGVAFYDPANRSWKGIERQAAEPKLGIDFGACLDSKRDRIYLGGADGVKNATPENSFFIYDLKTDKWIAPQAKGKFPLNFSALRASFHYDVANDVALILHYKDRMIYAYRPDTNEWAEPIPMSYEERKTSRNAFYDPELNVHFVYAAGDSKDDGVMWAYRYAKRKDP